MKRKILSILAIASILNVQAQKVVGNDTVFSSPFDFPLLLSANFGELRPNHFHNGLDIKTQGVVGKPIRCIGDGYISRVLVMHGGYGQAIFVNHPNGLTSVYGHVLSFVPKIQRTVRNYQYDHETFACDLKFAPEEYPVKKGEFIAMSGNEGASAGPHLHLELRLSDTGEYIDPMPYFKHLLKDKKAPVGSLVGFYPVTGKGVIDGSPERKLVPVKNLSRPVNAWGQIYTGISAKDYMDGTSNFYGVHSVTLFVDSVEVFRSVTDVVAPEENRMINGFTDYAEWVRTRRLIMRSRALPGNPLRLLYTGADRGIVTIDEERDYSFRYVLEDNFGNRRVYSFIVRGRKQTLPDYVPEADQILFWNKANLVRKPGMELFIPRNRLYDNAELSAQVVEDSCGISFSYALDTNETPLHDFCSLSIGIRHKAVADSSKYYIIQKKGKWSGSVGGKYVNGWVKAEVRSLDGTFAVAVDTVAPRIIPLGQKSWRTTRNIRFRIKETETGVSTYKVYVDGKFVLFGLKKGVLVIQDPEKIKKGVSHRIEVIVTDKCGNETRKQFKI